MGLAKMCGFLAASFLPLILLIDATDEGIHSVQTKKEYICSFPLVFKGIYQNAYREGKPNKVKITQVIKGSMKLGGKVKITTPDEYCIYFPEHVKVMEWLIYGIKREGVIECQNAEQMTDLQYGSEDALADIAINGC